MGPKRGWPPKGPLRSLSSGKKKKVPSQGQEKTEGGKRKEKGRKKTGHKNARPRSNALVLSIAGGGRPKEEANQLREDSEIKGSDPGELRRSVITSSDAACYRSLEKRKTR